MKDPFAKILDVDGQQVLVYLSQDELGRPAIMKLAVVYGNQVESCPVFKDSNDESFAEARKQFEEFDVEQGREFIKSWEKRLTAFSK